MGAGVLNFNHCPLAEEPQSIAEAIREDLTSLRPKVRTPLALQYTYDNIQAGRPYPYPQDGEVYLNDSGDLPQQPYGYYRAYIVETPGLSHRGQRRFVLGQNGETYYTDDHHDIL